MRRSRAGLTSPHLYRPSMSVQLDEGNVGQCDTRETQATTTTTETENVNSGHTTNTADAPDSRKRKAHKPPRFSLNVPKSKPYESTYPTTVYVRPQVKYVSIPNAPTPATGPAVHQPKPSTASAKPISRPSSTTSSTPTILPRRSPEPDDDNTSSDDELPTAPTSTIFFDTRLPIPCVHSTSSTKLYSPKRILRCPYRKTMLSLLRGVRTEPADSFATNKCPTAASRIQIYACYQQHWNPKFNIPVLTVLACCNSNISPPTLERSEPDKTTVKLFISTQSEQASVTFQLPLFVAMENVSEPIILRLGPNHPFPDSLTSYFLQTANSEIVLTWIKIWHLSSVGCFNLHTHGILVPQRPFPESEVHYLGVTGRRKMPYAINQIDFRENLLSMLDPIDLGNIGYKKFSTQTRPTLPDSGTLIKIMPERLLPRFNITPNWYYDKGIIIQAGSKVRRWPQLEPILYPPPFDHDEFPHEFPNPEALQKGEFAFKPPLITTLTTLEDMITEAVKKDPKEDPITTLMKYFNFKRKDIEARYMQLPFETFLKDKVSLNDDNGWCTFNSYHNGFNTGTRFLIPKNWSSLTRHPILGPR